MEHYIVDTLNQLLDEALEIKERTDTEFDKGKLFGYYEIISKFLNQAEAFGLSNKLPERIRNFNPESLLNKT